MSERQRQRDLLVGITPDMAASRMQVVTIITRSFAWLKLLSIAILVAVLRSVGVSYVEGRAFESGEGMIVTAVLIAGVVVNAEIYWALTCVESKDQGSWFRACETTCLGRMFGDSNKQRSFGMDLLRACSMALAGAVTIVVSLAIRFDEESIRMLLTAFVGIFAGFCIFTETFLYCEDRRYRSAMLMATAKADATNGEGDDSAV